MICSPAPTHARVCPRVGRAGRRQHARVSRCQATETAAPSAVESSVVTLKQAAGKAPSGAIGKVPAKEVFSALRAVQRAGLKNDEWAPVIGCNQYWRLVYTANSDAVAANNKNSEDGSGAYFPIVATNKLALDGTDSGRMFTASYLPHVAAVEFSGKYNIKGKLTNFDMAEIKVKLGPFVLGPFSIPSQVKDGKGPFFNFFYADEDIVCAVGRSGGIAMWAKAEPTFIAEKGLDL